MGKCGCWAWSFSVFTAMALLIIGIVYIVFQIVGCVGKPGPIKSATEISWSLQIKVNTCNIPPVLVNILYIIAGILVIIAGCWGNWGCWMGVIIRIYIIFFGVVIILREIMWPALLAQHIGVLDDYLGASLFLLWMWLLTAGWEGGIYWGLLVLMILSFILFLFEFVPKPGPIMGGGSSVRAYSSN
eukprot:NODE_4324_length_828_cov_20.446727_g3996_i0.p1 GENE.NODE_4324_length_828_cov_20.446727_g3996_i0~~NODE_4324_length_828_cov_20.446727_g3996_i0.p1  ORF type:complete len:215 (-),score=50.87 NODE_4324_length_828_cov_20.446727_g3996_i0:183-740(-)